MPRYTVEVFSNAVEAAALDEVGGRLRAAAEALRSEGVPLRYLSSILMPADELCLHLFDGPSAEAVVEVAMRAGLEPIRTLEVVTESGAGDRELHEAGRQTDRGDSP